MQHASGRDYDPSAWAKQRQERIKRALQARQKRQSGSPDKNHTFKPQLISSTDGSRSKLPPGARVGDASATQGAYDLTVLETMDGAFPPERTSANIYRDNRYDKDTGGNGRGRGPMDMGEARDSLDRLAVSTTDADRLRLSRQAGRDYDDGRGRRLVFGEEGGAAVTAKRGSRRRSRDDAGGRWTGPTRESTAVQNGACDDFDPATKYGGIEEEALKGAIGRGPAAAAATGDDALSHELKQRPHVRGSASEEHPPDQRQRECDETAWNGVDNGPSHVGGAGVQWEGRVGGGGIGEGRENEGAPPEKERDGGEARRQEDEDFFGSLRGGEGVGVGDIRRRGGNGVASCRQPARARHPKRPEWNSDTAAVASLGGPQAAILTDSSAAAVQARRESPFPRRGGVDGVSTITDSPYAAGGGTISSSNNNNHSAVPTSGRSNVNVAWEHKHTKTLPWGEEEDVGGGGGGRDGIPAPGDDGGGRHGGGFGSLSATVDLSSREGTAQGRGGRAREGYRLQMMPSPSTGSLKAMYRGCREDGRFGEGGDASVEMESPPPPEKEQLRRNLSLLKKKMHSQAGSRRSQSAGPRAGDLFGESNAAPSGVGGADPHLGGRQHLHMTTGTAPAMMSTNPEAFSRHRETSGRELGRTGASGVRGRPPLNGPGSPYVIDPNPRGGPAGAAAHRSSARPQQHRQPPPQPHYRQHQQQAGADAPGRRRRDQRPFDDSHDSPRAEVSGFTAAAAATAAADLAARGSRYRSGLDPGDVGGGVGGRATREANAAAGRPGGRKGGFEANHNHSPGGQNSPNRRRAWQGEHGDGDPGGGSRRVTGVGDGERRGQRGNVDDLPPGAFPDREVQLQECKICGRRFTPEALERHSRACQKVFQAKRKVFDAAEMRIKGTEQEKFAKSMCSAVGGGKTRGRAAEGRGGKASTRRFDDTPVGCAAGGAKSSKWRQQSKQFRDALRQARVVTDAQKSGKSLADLPPPKPSVPDPSFVPCPYCGRRFNELAGERHMQHCKNIKAKPTVLKKGSGRLAADPRQCPTKSVVGRVRRKQG